MVLGAAQRRQNCDSFSPRELRWTKKTAERLMRAESNLAPAGHETILTPTKIYEFLRQIFLSPFGDKNISLILPRNERTMGSLPVLSV